jgi:hypothetical protein
MTLTRPCSFPDPTSASRALPDRSRTKCLAEVIDGERLVVARNGSRRKVTLEGLREVLVGESPDDVCWTVRAGPDSDGGFYTWIRRSHGDATAESGMGGDKLPPGQLINFWIGKAEGTPLFVMARTAPQVQRVTVVLASAARRDLALSPVIEDFGLLFAAGPLPDDDPPVRMEIAIEGGETQIGALRWPPRRFRPPLRGT